MTFSSQLQTQPVGVPRVRFAMLAFALVVSPALAQECETVDGPFGPIRICPVDPQTPPSSESQDPQTGSTWEDPAREQRRQARAAQRAQHRLERTVARVNAVIEEANAEIDAGRHAQALDLFWAAYRKLPDEAALRANVIRQTAYVGLVRGQRALLRGDRSQIRRLQRDYDDIAALFYDLSSVPDQGNLILEAEDIKSIIADLRDAQEQRRRPAVEQPLDPAAILAENARQEAGTAPLQLGIKWALGRGPRDYVFGISNQITRDLRDSTHGRQARYHLYQKYGGRLRNGDSFTNYQGTFGLIGLFTAPTLSEQFVGSFRIDAEVIDGRIRYTAYNNTSFTSAAYGLGPDWEVGTFRPMSNMRQTYVWWEPVQRWPGRR